MFLIPTLEPTPSTFSIDLEGIKQRARTHISEGAVTPGYWAFHASTTRGPALAATSLTAAFAHESGMSE